LTKAKYGEPRNWDGLVGVFLILAKQQPGSRVAGTLRLQADCTYGAGVDATPEAPVGICVPIADRAPLRDPERGELTGDTLFLPLGGLPRGTIC
jgi:hypothetical protein